MLNRFWSKRHQLFKKICLYIFPKDKAIKIAVKVSPCMFYANQIYGCFVWYSYLGSVNICSVRQFLPLSANSTISNH